MCAIFVVFCVIVDLNCRFSSQYYFTVYKMVACSQKCLVACVCVFSLPRPSCSHSRLTCSLKLQKMSRGLCVWFFIALPIISHSRIACSVNLYMALCWFCQFCEIIRCRARVIQCGWFHWWIANFGKNRAVGVPLDFCMLCGCRCSLVQLRTLSSNHNVCQSFQESC